MRITKASVQDFRSIKSSGEFSLDERITVLVGKNDQGKTNLLKALESFDTDFEYQGSDICSYSETGRKIEAGEIESSDIPIVTLWLTMEGEDKAKLREINKKLDKVKTLEVTKYFDNIYSVESTECDIGGLASDAGGVIEKIKARVAAMSELVATHFQRHPPFAASKPQYDQSVQRFLSADFDSPESIDQALTVLFGDLLSLPDQDKEVQSDIATTITELEEFKEELKVVTQDVVDQILELMPRFVYFSSFDLLTDSVKIGEFLTKKEEYRTLNNLLILAGLDTEALSKKSKYNRRSATEVASATITGLVNESWHQEKVNVNIGIDGDDLIVFVTDETGALDPPSRRSDGFQWFLSFYINFIVGSRGELKKTILLLDNPGVLLHALGQEDLRATMERISETNQIVYATHSPFLVYREYLGRTRIISKKGGKVGTSLTEKFWESDFDALATIRAALGLSLRASFFASKENVIVEGYSDYLILEAMALYNQRTNRPNLDLSKIFIAPINGADKVPFFCLILRAEGVRFLALLDNDQKGRKVAKELLEMHNVQNEAILKLDEVTEESGVDVTTEDLIDASFYNKAVNKAYKELLSIEIEADALDTTITKQTKKYEKYFKAKRLGDFDKILVARQIYGMVSNKSCTDQDVGESTLNNFSRLFQLINKRLK